MAAKVSNHGWNCRFGDRDCAEAYLHAFLGSLDGGDIAGDTTANDDQILLICRIR
jgi:hypothetical protein